MELVTIAADDRAVEFRGELLGSASSQRPGKDRWSEISIYRTAAGQYVISGVGRTQVPGEVDRVWAKVSGTPEGVIETLHMYDSDEVRYLPWTNKSALLEAARNDPTLQRAMRGFTERVA